MSKKKKIILTLSITVVVLGLAVGLVFFLKNRTRDKKTVNVYPVESLGYTSDMIGNWDDTLSGNVVINKEQKIYLTSTDQISEVKVQEGDTVKAGDVLLVYDTTAQSLQLETMRADVEIARTAVLAAERDLNILQNTTPVEPTTEEPTTEEQPPEEPTPGDNPTSEEQPPEEPTPGDNPTSEEQPPEEPTPGDNPTSEEQPPEEPTPGDNPTSEEQPGEVQPQASVTPREVEQLSQPPIHNEGETEVEGDMLDEQTYTKEELAQAIVDKQNEIKRLNIDYQLKQVELEILEYQTATGEVLCNFDGVVKTVADQETAILNNEPFIVVSGTDGYTVQGYIGELALASVQEGDTVSMFSYDNGMTYTGVITEISDMPTSDYYSYDGTQQSYYPMTISVTEGDDLAQGMYMEITVEQSGTASDSVSDSIYIPLALVDKENGSYYVMKEVDGKLQKVFIKTGKIVWGDTIEVQSGVSMDDYLAIPYSKNAEEGVKTVEKSADEAYGY